MANTIDKYAGLYVFGSIDGIKWVFLGGIEKKGTIVDIGTIVERIDCKYIRIGFVGRISADSVLNSLEISVEPKLEQKLR